MVAGRLPASVPAVALPSSSIFPLAALLIVPPDIDRLVAVIVPLPIETLPLMTLNAPDVGLESIDVEQAIAFDGQDRAYW